MLSNVLSMKNGCSPFFAFFKTTCGNSATPHSHPTKIAMYTFLRVMEISLLPICHCSTYRKQFRFLYIFNLFQKTYLCFFFLFCVRPFGHICHKNNLEMAFLQLTWFPWNLGDLFFQGKTVS